MKRVRRIGPELLRARLAARRWLRHKAYVSDDLHLRQDVPLAPLTSLGVGGRAHFLAEAASPQGLVAALMWARARRLPAFVLGGGSNVLFCDEGIDGLVIRPRFAALQVKRCGSGLDVRAEAGAAWQALVDLALQAEAGGLECLNGIPGSCGAAPVQNIGAYGQEVAPVLQRVHAVDRRTMAPVTLPVDRCGMGYRRSHFKDIWRGRFVLTAIDVRLGGAVCDVAYDELQRVLGSRRAPIGDVAAAVWALRRSKSMVLDPADANGRSAGSFFTNPIVEAQAAARVAEMCGERPPVWQVGAGKLKLSAAWLIERAGFGRGFVAGRVGLSTRHALALINRGGATAGELVALATRIAGAVFTAFAVRLPVEPELVGFSREMTRGLT